MTCPVHTDVETTTPCSRCGVGYCDDCLVTLQNDRVCGNCKGELLRDVISGTTYGQLQLASFGPRAIAWLIDRMMLWILQGLVFWLTISRLVGFTTPTIPILLQVIINSGYLVYEGAMVARRGQTLGKMAMRVRVTRPDGSPVAPWQAWTRAVVRFGGYLILVSVNFVSPAFGLIASVLISLVDYVPGLATPQRTTLHDLIARTRVARDLS